jgi:dienelactone hydrolase
MTSANDWTKEMSTKGFPELKRIYTLLGAPANVMLKRGEHFDHNYNYVSRAALYSWMNQHLKLGLKEPIVEPDYRRLTRDEMSVWDTDHPAPKAGDPEFERGLLRRLHEDAQKQLSAAASSPGELRRAFGGGVEAMIGRTLSDVGPVEWEMLHKTEHDSWIQMGGLLRIRDHGEELPALFCYPKQWNGTTVVWLTGEGKAGIQTPDGSLQEPALKLVEAGATVMSVDLFQQGEFRPDASPLTKTGRVKNTREAAAYTFGYNHTVFAQRVHDVLSVLQFIKSNERPTKQLRVVGLNGAGPCVAAACAISGHALDGAVIDTGGFRFGQVKEIHDPNFLPGGAKYGDLPGLLALAAPTKLWVAGETAAALALPRAQYKAANASANLVVMEGGATGQTMRQALEALGK